MQKYCHVSETEKQTRYLENMKQDHKTIAIRNDAVKLLSFRYFTVDSKTENNDFANFNNANNSFYLNLETN